MPSDANGVFSLPPGYLASTGTTIEVGQHNPPLEDIASALTARLMRSGVAPMTGPLKGYAGSALAPGYSFADSITTGFYKTTAGFGVAVGGVKVAEFGAGGLIVGGPPIGSGMDFYGTTAPAGWLFPYGQAVSRETYAALFAVLGTTYGAGDGSTTFNLPDKRGRYSAGWDAMGGVSASRITSGVGGVDGSTIGAVGSAQAHSISQANLPSVTFPHTLTVASVAAAVNVGTSLTTVSKFHFAPTGGNTAVETVSLNLQSNLIFSSISGGSITSGGSGVALSTLPPTIICNYIIFAGV